MALVNDKHKFIFFHLYKCGGTSLRTFLNENLVENQEVLSGHCNVRDVKYDYDYRGKKYEDIFNEMFKFTVVRNPFAFLLSIYHYAKTYKDHMWHDKVIGMKFNDFPKFYMEEVNKSRENYVFGSNVVTTLYDFISDKDGNVIVDFVAKLENIENDFKLICDKIGVEHAKYPLENVNINNNKPYQKVYTKKTRAYVEKHFAKDLEYFGYEF